MRTNRTILLVEDNPDDVLLVQLAFTKIDASVPLMTVSDGQQAIDYLSGEAHYANREEFPIPALILLDLHMPRVSGFEFLDWLRDQPKLRHLPVVVLKGSPFSPYVNRAYEAGPNSFVVKSADLRDFTNALKQTVVFWLGVCQLPETMNSSGGGEDNVLDLLFERRKKRDLAA
jgi:CheY-like chemotaxis protein